MTVLLAAAEDIDFPYNGIQFGLGTTGGQFRSGYARGRINVSQAVPQNMLGMSRVFPAGGVAEVWLSHQMYFSSNSQLQGKGEVGVGNYASTGKGIYTGVATAAAARLAVFMWNGSTMTEIAAESGSSLISGMQKIDLYVSNIAGTSDIKVYLNGVELIAHSEDLSGLSISTVDCICLLAAGAGSGNWFVSELIAASEDTRSFGLVTNYPNLAGDANAWTGAYTTVDEALLSDDDLMYVNSNDADAQLNLSPLPTGNFGIKAVVASARAVRSSGSTPTGIALGVKSGGSYDYGTKQNLAYGWDTYIRLMSTNPVTANPWTQAEVDALQLNLRTKA